MHITKHHHYQQNNVPATEDMTTNTNSEVELKDERLYINRELSWLEFNKRVLEEAEDHTHPLLERLKFLSIFSSNLDEFFMIRVAGLMEQRALGVSEFSADGLTPAEQLQAIREMLLPMYHRQAHIYNTDVKPSLEAEGIHLLTFDHLTSEEKNHFRADFVDNIMPVLTPLALDTGHPFPRLLNRSLNIAFVLFDPVNGEEEMKIGVLQLPASLSRLVRVQRQTGYHFLPLEEVIRAHAEVLFPGLRLQETHLFRVTRDADVDITDDEANDLIAAVVEGVRQRRWGTDAVRLEVGSDMPEYLLTVLLRSLELTSNDAYSLELPLNLSDFLELMKLEKRKLKDVPFTGKVPVEFNVEGSALFDLLKQEDVMVHHPFDSFTNSVVKFILTAANDAHVLAIKITLYRAGGKSPVIDALKQAVRNGKTVTAFVELKARFDEEANINWAKELENSGVHVVYGMPGLKVHCKLCLVIRREGNKVLTYAHVSTGNYNHATSRVYTDIGIFTGRQELERDFVHLFNLLTGYSKHSDWQYLGVAPVNLRNRFIELIRRERANAEAGKKGHIIAKMNALVDATVIRELYRASMAGVKIELIVRGICCLRPGIAGVSENITVRSVLDRFLEHSRIFWFFNDNAPQVFISSADWMGRNFDRRVEVLFPVLEPRIQERLYGILHLYLTGEAMARTLMSDGSYRRSESRLREGAVRAQMVLLGRGKSENAL